MSSILITGGFGLLGGRIARHLSANGSQVILGSRFKKEVPDWLETAEVQQMNWNDLSQLSAICDNVDIIVHSAGMSAEECAENPLAAFEFNTLGTMKLIEASKKSKKVKKFIYLSTVHVYKSPLEGLISEETCPNNLHPYASSHRSAEFGVLYANSAKVFRGYNLRLSNGFGAPTHPDVKCWKLLVNDLCRQAVENGVIKLNSTGIQKRDFIPIKNITSIIGKLVLKENDGASGLLNVGSGTGMTILEMSHQIQKRCHVLFGYTPELKVPKSEINETEKVFEYSIDRLRSLSLAEFCNIDEELDELLLFCKKNFG
ncbi:NADH(P)-binding protein, PF13460 family [Leptospira wolbachii serovar Codice str. CDC]|uniref:NADH(P)-binding protein, PF13460 family n=1 Tax=Leptospira wolbachii serovar Codice str. CDC TaxID=1218599 RepID=R9A745_9LEPT|nr:SDR family oxidoreductase [Leptospira wolbachii]EOQ98016.1 NADH(P)-binding protein, PF13460 family [Leptospira wolbachii serovar Codice str. CDC]